MKILSGLEGTASAFAGQALEGYQIQQRSKEWGIFKRENAVEVTEKDGSKNQSIPVYEAGITRGAPEKAYHMSRVLKATHVETLDIGKSSTISSAPQEDGTFLSYNKIKNPYQITLRLICDGSDSGNMWENMLPGFVRGLMGNGVDDVKKAFMTELDRIVEDTDLYYVSTPEKMYRNVNIIGYRIHRGPDGTSDMLIADITLQEVRQVSATGWTTAKKPQGEPTKDNGTVQPKPMPDASAGVAA